MACLSLAWVEQLCVWLIIVAAVVAIVRLFLPYAAGIGLPSIVVSIIQIVLWAVVAIAAVYILFGLFGCIVSGPFHPLR